MSHQVSSLKCNLLGHAGANLLHRKSSGVNVTCQSGHTHTKKKKERNKAQKQKKEKERKGTMGDTRAFRISSYA